jgi:CRP-like cAMP-binding protein
MLAKRRSSTLSVAGRSSPANGLLAALPPADYKRIALLLEIVPLKLKSVLYRPGEIATHVHFPGGGFCSIVTVLQNGDMVEVATVGREGMVGLSALHPDRMESTAAMVQAETATCYRMPAEPFRREMDRRGSLYAVMTVYEYALTGAIMQMTACNAVHSVEQRLARWLLMAHDRMEANEFPLTQEFVAMMLGATRPTVTVVAGTLQRAGLITYHRGHVTIVDRERLEAASCECYQTTTSLLKGLSHRA